MIHNFIDGKTNPVVKALVSFEELLSLRLSDHFALVVGCINNNWLNLWKKDACKVFTGISPPLGNVIILGETMVHCSRQICTYFEAKSCDEGKTFLQDEASDNDDGGGGGGGGVAGKKLNRRDNIRSQERTHRWEEYLDKLKCLEANCREKNPGKLGIWRRRKAQCFRSVRRFGAIGSRPDFSRVFPRHLALPGFFHDIWLLMYHYVVPRPTLPISRTHRPIRWIIFLPKKKKEPCFEHLRNRLIDQH